MADHAVEFRRVSKTYGSAKAVREVSFEVRPGEFFSLLGPSGCGKTTTLRMIAGFEVPDADGGEVRIQGRVVNQVRPYDRGISMVFQSYALFPHMSVLQNVAFGLEQHGVPRADIPPRVRRALEMVRLDPDTFGPRRPAQLSGGQRQRVALARALVLEPPILLLDEPLGAIDLKLRKEMQLELKALNRQLGITFIYVTHDQEEALTMSDRVAVMDQARIAQLGTPAEIYERPRTAFVARFIGESNLLSGRVLASAGGEVQIEGAQGGTLRVQGSRPVGEAAQLALRPEWVELLAPEDAREGNRVPGRVRDIIYLGETIHLLVETPGWGVLTAAVRNQGQLARPVRWQPGAEVHVCWPAGVGVLLEEA